MIPEQKLRAALGKIRWTKLQLALESPDTRITRAFDEQFHSQSASQILNNLFVWHTSPQGEKYWRRIHNELCDKQ